MENYEAAFDSICRLCMTPYNTEMVSLFEENSDELSCYGQSVITFAKIILSKTDKLPQKMCQSCLSQLRLVIAFKFRSEWSHKLLTNLKSRFDKTGNINGKIFECVLFKQYFPDDNEVLQNSKEIVDCGKTKNIADSESHISEEISKSLEETKSIVNKIKEINKKIKKIENYTRSIQINKNDRLAENIENYTENIEDNSAIPDYLRELMLDNIDNNNDNNIDNEPSIPDDDNRTEEEDILTSIEKVIENEKNFDDMFTMKRAIYNARRKTKRRRFKKDIFDEDKEYICDYCQKKMTSRLSLQQHIRRHTDKFVCEQCGKVFPTNSELRSHLVLIHKSGHYYPCPDCGLKTPSRFVLKEHRRLHTGERPFACEQCGLTFRRRYILNKHLVMHEEKAFQCPSCPAKFRRSRDVSYHCNSVHARRFLFACGECRATYAKNSSVRRHLAHVHRIPRHLQGKILRISTNTTELPPQPEQ